MKKAVTLLCCLNILCILYSAGRKYFSHEHLFSLVCQLFTLYFVVHTGHAPVIQVAEGVETTLMRRQIQEINWKILWYKTSVLSFIKIRENDKHEHLHHHHRGHLRNSESEIIHRRSTSV